MIQENELRLGNYVLGQTKQITKVDGFFNENKAIYTDVEDERVRFIIHYLSECEGVELTEEILLRCGFERIENNWKVLDVVFASLSWERLAGMTLTLEHESIFIPHIKYLHQLQNLYFMLCNEELEIIL